MQLHDGSAGARAGGDPIDLSLENVEVGMLRGVIASDVPEIDGRILYHNAPSWLH